MDAPAAEPDNPGLLVIVVAFNADVHLARCLATLDSPGVAVIDNATSDTTRAIVAAAGGDYLPSGSNLGFAAAVNLGLRSFWDGHRDVLVLNPDARITRPDLLRLQAALHARPRTAAVGPALVDESKATQRADWPIPSPVQIWLDALGLGRLWRGRSFVTGAVLLLNGEALSDVGTFDERYFLYAEEADWQVRALRRGWSVAVVREVTAVHVGGASSGDPAVRERLFHASGELFARRWYGAVGWLIIRTGSVVAAARRALFGSAAARESSRRVLGLYLRGPVRCQQDIGRYLV